MSNEMGTLASLGMGSGIDIQGLVDKLISNEGKARAEKLEAQESECTTKITGYGVLKNTLKEFQDKIAPLQSLTTYQSRVGVVVNDPSVSADINYFAATAGSSALPGNYSVEIQKLAKANKFNSAEYSTDQIRFNTGSIKITLGYGAGTTQECILPITATDDNNTLAGIAASINARTDEMGVNASILRYDAGVKLIITANKTGSVNQLHFDLISEDSGTNFSLTNFIADLDEAIPPQDAVVLIDSQTVTSSSNTLVNFIQGVTLDLYKAEVGKVHDLEVTVDRTAEKQHILDFIADYNKLIEKINDLGKSQPNKNANSKNKKKTQNDDNSNEKTDKTKENTGDLANDWILKRVIAGLRATITQTVATSEGTLSLQAIGITSERKTGKLVINNTKLFDESMSAMPDQIGKMFTDPENGVGVALSDLADSFIGDTIENGQLQFAMLGRAIYTQEERKKDTLVSKLKLQTNLQKLENMYLKKYSAMDRLLGEMNTFRGEVVKKLSSAFVEPGKFN